MKGSFINRWILGFVIALSSFSSFNLLADYRWAKDEDKGWKHLRKMVSLMNELVNKCGRVKEGKLSKLGVDLLADISLEMIMNYRNEISIVCKSDDITTVGDEVTVFDEYENKITDVDE